MIRNHYVCVDMSADGGFNYLRVYGAEEATAEVKAKALSVRDVIRRSCTYGQGGARSRDGKGSSVTLYDAMQFGTQIMALGVPENIRANVYDLACLHIKQVNIVMEMSYAVKLEFLNKVNRLDRKSYDIVKAARKAKETEGKQDEQPDNN